ncbi:MAG: GNAT family N-acetyltransferase [Thermoanaerobaculia bacterium]
MTVKREIQYRDRKPSELDECARLIERVLLSEFDLPLGDRIARELEEAGAAFDPERDQFTTAEQDGKILGTLLVAHDGTARAEVTKFSWLVVDPASRGRGIGRELLFRAIEACRQKRLRTLRARAFALSAAGPRLFWMYGFRVVELVPLTVAGKSREMVLFEKRLTPAAD